MTGDNARSSFCKALKIALLTSVAYFPKKENFINLQMYTQFYLTYWLLKLCPFFRFAFCQLFYILSDNKLSKLNVPYHFNSGPKILI